MIYPNLDNVKLLGFDTETYDPYLLEDGPGWARGFGHIVGVSLATLDKKWYFPLRHTTNPEDNYELEPTLKFLKDVLEKDTPKVGANVIYDVGWLAEEGIEVKGFLHDIQFAEALIDNNARSYSLDSIAKKYLDIGKTDKDLYQWLANKFGGAPSRKQAANIYRAPPNIVRPYAVDDAQLPLRILLKQAPTLERLNLEGVYKLECGLVPLLIAMRQRGMPVDLIAAEEARDDLAYSERFMRNNLKELAGFRVGVNTRADLQRLFDKFNIEYPRTAAGNPSFTKAWLLNQHHPVATLVSNIRGIAKARNDFIEKAIIDKAVNGKIYPSLHPLRSDDGGTITGRFSSSKPNGQQLPSRDEELAPIVRGIFVPEKGYTHWCKMDYSQIEYRCFAHFAEKYINDSLMQQAYQNSETDYHVVVSNILGGNIPRKWVKNYNFASLYGAGKGRLTAMLQEYMNPEEAERLFTELKPGVKPSKLYPQLIDVLIDRYRTRFPQAHKLMEAVSETCEKTCEIRTLSNRRIAFNLFVPSDKSAGKQTPLPYDIAYYKWGGAIKVANSYKGLNYALQGSAADVMKMGLKAAWDSGIFKKIGVPHMTVHDEIDISVNLDMRQEIMELKEIMENTAQLSVPIIMDTEIGPNWGNVNEWK